MTLKHPPLAELMHAVLDGEASDAEARELEVRLAADPAARAEFEELKRLFEALAAVPKEHVPEGLVASITSALPQAPGNATIQPFPARRVLGHTSFGISSRAPIRSLTMTEQSSRRIFAHRKAWLGAGIAAAVAVVVAQVAFDFPLPKDVVGTVVPAQRYRAAQNGSEQVQVGAPAAQATPTAAAPEANRAVAEKSAADSALEADHTARAKADHAAQMSADHNAQMNADRSAQKNADHAAQMSADRAAQMNADRAAQKSADHTAQMNADHAAQMNAERAAMQKNASRAQTEMKAERSGQQ